MNSSRSFALIGSRGRGINSRLTLTERLTGPADPGVAARSLRRVRAETIATQAVFTLIELLVVIAIIAILATILLPALNQAKETARKSVCLSQQKQVALMLSYYADDHDAWFPLSRNNTYVGPVPYPGITTAMGYSAPWGLFMVYTKYAPYPGDIFGGYEDAAKMIHERTPLGCPSIRPLGRDITLHQWLQTYGIRELPYLTNQDWSNQGLTDPKRINLTTSIRRAYPPQRSPSQYPVGTETTRQYPGSKWWSDRPIFEQVATLSYRATFTWEGMAYRPHRGWGNVWFLDGHATSVNQQDSKALIEAPGDSSDAINWNDDMFQNSWPLY